MSGEYISREAAKEAVCVTILQDGIRDALKCNIDDIPAADVVKVVRCKNCKHRIVNEHYGEKGYMKLKAMCELDTGDPFALARNAWNGDWFCADGERKEGGPDA